MIVKDDPSKVPFLNIYVVILVALGAACSWILLDRASNYNNVQLDLHVKN
jgi:hypothetical protein